MCRSTEFVIPSCREDLVEEPENPYYVERLSFQDFDDLELSLQNDDPFFIEEPETFVKIFQFFRNYQEQQFEHKVQTGILLCQGFRRLKKVLKTNFAHGEFTGSSSKERCRNALGIYVFLSSWCVTELEGTLKSKEKKGNDISEIISDFLKVFNKTLKLPFQTLFNMGSPDDELGRCISQMIFKLVEHHPHVKGAGRAKTLTKSQDKFQIFHIVYSLVEKCGRLLDTIGFVTNLIPKNFDFLPEVLAELLSGISANTTKDPIPEVIREMLRFDPKETVADQTGFKNTWAFMNFLTDSAPDSVFQSLSIMYSLLDSENPNLRSSLLSIFGTLLTKDLLKDEENENAVKTRNDLFAILLERLCDTKALVRKKAVSTLKLIIEKRCVPKNYIGETLLALKDKTFDKKKSVRSVAISTIISFITCNPFGPSLKLSAFTETLIECNEELKTKELLSENRSKENLNNVTMEELEELEEENLEVEPRKVDKEVEHLLLKIAYIENTIEFVTNLHVICNELNLLLDSTDASDVIEAIQFFEICFEFNIESVCSPSSEVNPVSKMLGLVWKGDEIQNTVCSAYEKFYFHPCDSSDHEKFVSLVVKNLLNFMGSCEGVTFFSAQKLLRVLCKRGNLTDPMMKMIWDTFMMKVPNTTEEQSINAIKVISCVAGQMHNHLKDNMSQLLENGFGVRGRKNPIIAKFSAKTLAKFCKIQTHLSNDHLIFQKVYEFIDYLPEDQETLINLQGEWYSACEEIINAVFTLADNPAFHCSHMIRSLYRTFEKIAVRDCKEEGILNRDNELILARVVFMVGHVAIKQLVLMDNIEEKLKEQHQLTQKDDDYDEIEKEMGVDQAANDEHSEHIAHITETEIVTGRGFLAMFTPLIVKLSKSRFMDRQLGPLSVLALCKLMTISQRFCEENLLLLFTILKKSTLREVRVNIAISLSDLIVRFPNALEPWTADIYYSLSHDTDESVRCNLLRVLSHLILNDMIKVKGHISVLAKCMIDPSFAISSLAKTFFSELSQKDKEIYNHLPDIVSQLSSDAQELTSSQFEKVMAALLNYVTKEKEREQLAEKLCQRFRSIFALKQAQYLAFCLSQLTFTEKSSRKVMENFDCYVDKLYDKKVYSSFQDVIVKMKKTTKVQLKEEIEEFRLKFEKEHEKRFEDEQVSQQSSQPAYGEVQRLLKKQKTNQMEDVTQNEEPDEEESQAEEEQEDSETELETQNIKNTPETQEEDEVADSPVRKPRKSKNKRTIPLDDFEDDDEESNGSDFSDGFDDLPDSADDENSNPNVTPLKTPMKGTKRTRQEAVQNYETPKHLTKAKRARRRTLGLTPRK